MNIFVPNSTYLYSQFDKPKQYKHQNNKKHLANNILMCYNNFVESKSNHLQRSYHA